MGSSGQEAGELAFEGVFAWGELVLVLYFVVEARGLVQCARALELVAVEELLALGLLSLKGARELGWCCDDLAAAAAAITAVPFPTGCARTLCVEFQCGLGELMDKVAVAHVLNRGGPGELPGRFSRDMVVFLRLALCIVWSQLWRLVLHRFVSP
jgi:hypothetical protein